MKLHFALLRGDGIGPEIVDSAVRVLKHIAPKFGHEFSFTPYLIGGAAYGFIQGICMPVLYYLAVHKMPVHRRGVAGGTVYCLLDLGVGAGSFLWGVVIGAFGFTATFLSAAALLVLAAALSLAFYCRDPQ